MTVPSVYSFLYWRTLPIYFFISTNKISKTIFIMSVCSHIVAGRETRKVGSPLSSEMSYPGRHVLTKQETSLGRGPGREQQGEGPREDGSARGSRSRVYGERVRFGLSVADRSDPGPLLEAGGPSPLRQHGFQQGAFWEDTWTSQSSLLPLPDSSGW